MVTEVPSGDNRDPSPLLHLDRSCNSIESAVDYLLKGRTWLKDQEIVELFKELRQGGVNLKQVNAAIERFHLEFPDGSSHEHQGTFRKDGLPWLLKELDRRYFILQQAVWDFALIDRNRSGSISEQGALFLFQQVHGEHFSMPGWMMFLGTRENPGSFVTWDEIEVPICDVFSGRAPIINQVRKTENITEGEKIMTMNEIDEDKEKESQKERGEKKPNDQVLWPEQFTANKDSNITLKEGDGHDPSTEDISSTAKHKTSVHKNNNTIGKERLDYLMNLLSNAIKCEEERRLEFAISSVRKEKGASVACKHLLDQAETILKKLKAFHGLSNALKTRQLVQLEVAISAVKRGGWEKELNEQMLLAASIMEKLKQLEMKKKAVLELSQRVVAELKSYSKPPKLVHQVMSATFLLLGEEEAKTLSWPATQILIGKTGKDNLKRRVVNCQIESIPLPVAERAMEILRQYDFSTVQDTSLGCATFYTWAEGMIEEVKEIHH